MSGVDRSRLPGAGRPAPVPFPGDHPRRRSPAASTCGSCRTTPSRSCRCVAVVPGGSAADPADRAGLAAFAADLLDDGAGDLDGVGLADALARIGAELDVEVWPDAAVVTVTALARHADAGGGAARRPAGPPALRRRRRGARARAAARSAAADAGAGARRAPIAPSCTASTAVIPTAITASATPPASAPRPSTRSAAFHAAQLHAGGGHRSWSAARSRPTARAGSSRPRWAGWRGPAAPPAPDLDAADAGAGVGRRAAGAAARRAAVGAAHRPGRRRAHHARLPRAGAVERRARRPVREPPEPDAAPAEGLHLRRAIGLRLPARPRAVQRADQRAGQRHRRRRAATCCAKWPTCATARRPPPASWTGPRRRSAAAIRCGFETAQQVARGVAQLALHHLPDDHFAQLRARARRRARGRCRGRRPRATCGPTR